MNKLWTYQKASKSRAKMSLLLIISTVLAAFYYSYYPFFSQSPSYAFQLGSVFGVTAAYYLLILLPLQLTEKSVNDTIKDHGCKLSKNQDVSVSFGYDGILQEIFYDDSNYKKGSKEDAFYHIKSVPSFGDPQIHFVNYKNWSEDNFVVVTERTANMTISTVYIYQQQ